MTELFDRSLIELARKLPGGNIGVIGDLVCDHTIFGRTKRISREAPVLILDYEREHLTLGGAANAIHNLATLGVRVLPIGIVGNDEGGRNLAGLIAGLKIDTSLIFVDSTRPTTVKKRVLGSGLHTTYQQMLRIDQGSHLPVSGEVEEKILKGLDLILTRCDVLIVSDYDYGMISPRVLEKINAMAEAGTIAVLVDSRYRLPSYRRPALITPNEPEAAAAAGMEINDDRDVALAAGKLHEMTGADAVCITRGKQGMYLQVPGAPGWMVPIFGSDEIADVTGAGDTVMAVFAAARAAGISLADAARLATVAGGLVVMKSGTATITVDEICRAIEETNDG